MKKLQILLFAIIGILLSFNGCAQSEDVKYWVQESGTPAIGNPVLSYFDGISVVSRNYFRGIEEAWGTITVPIDTSKDYAMMKIINDSDVTFTMHMEYYGVNASPFHLIQVVLPGETQELRRDF